MSLPNQKVVVSRGDRYDIAEWAPGEPEWFGAGTENYRPTSFPTFFGIGGTVLILVLTWLLVAKEGPTLSKPLVPTLGDLQAVHAGVSVGGADVRKERRLTAGDAVETDAEGRGRLRLDDGTVVLLDASTRLEVKGGGEGAALSLAVTKGRVFVQGAPGARASIDVGGVTALVSGADAGIERTAQSAKVYVSTAEITVRSEGKETTVRAGDTATVNAGKVTVAPERGFDDWTGGLAAPWAVQGPPRRAVGELWGKNPDGTGSPLTLRAHDVKAAVIREVAETEVRTTFFNAGSTTVTGDYRLALPPGAIVSRFATVRGESVTEGRIALAARSQSAPMADREVLEWAGEGWVRGTIPNIPAGATVSVIVGYTEWLSPRPKGDGKNLLVQYRYPMAGDAAPPLVGELSARVDASPSKAISMASGLGARVSGQAVEVRRSDFRPTADLVVDVEIEPFEAPPAEDKPAPGAPLNRPSARMYVAPSSLDDDGGSTVLVRTEAPRDERAEGVTLALVLDTSASTEPAMLDAERALVEAVLKGLGERDRAVVVAADQGAATVGPKALAPVDPAFRKAVAEGLSKLSPGGATDVGRALEAGADALPGDAPAAMVIYVGDGWPTVGDGTVEQMKARLSRRPGGSPRLGAVAVGPLANRFALAGLVRGSGPLFEIADSADAAKVAVSLLAEALRPTVAGVEMDLGPEVERVYPRGARAVLSGDTVTAVGRFRNDPPTEITLRWRDGRGAHEEKRPVVLLATADEADLGRRWAAARVEEIALRGRGREAATDVALRAGLLTPWTGWLAGASDGYVPTRLETRILDLAVGQEGGFTASFATPPGALGSLTGVVHEVEPIEIPEEKDDVVKSDVARAARRLIDEAGAAIRACRDSRAALSPEMAGTLQIGMSLDGDGHASDVKVKLGGSGDDAALDRCIEVVVSGLVFPASGLKIKIDVAHSVMLPAFRGALRGRKCSATSTLPMPLRRGVWQERLDRGGASNVYLDAKQTCELPAWTDRRALLELILGHEVSNDGRVRVARELDAAGEGDAAALLRREAVRRAPSPEALKDLQLRLIGEEHYPHGVFRKQYRAAADDAGRLAVVRRFLAIAPHDVGLRRRLLALLEATSDKAALEGEVRRFRRDPFADAGLLADGASALRRAGDEAEARRAFGELCERAPTDPWARAFLGDRLRNEGWFEDAARAYAVLDQLIPDDPAAILRLALAHAGAGRIDIAERLLARVAATGGRAGDGKLGELSARVALDLVAEARKAPGLSAEDADRLVRAALELPRPAPGSIVVLVRAPAGAKGVIATLARGPKDAREARAPEVSAPGVGLYALRIDPGETSAVVLELSAPLELPPARATKVRVDAVTPPEGGKPPTVVTTEVELPISGKPLELKWSGGAFVAG